MKASAIVLGVAAAHYLLSLSLLVLAGGLVMGRFDQGSPAGLAESVVIGLMRLVSFPVAAFATGDRAGGGAILFALNSLLWGALAGALVFEARRWGRGQTGKRAKN